MKVEIVYDFKYNLMFLKSEQDDFFDDLFTMLSEQNIEPCL